MTKAFKVMIAGVAPAGIAAVMFFSGALLFQPPQAHRIALMALAVASGTVGLIFGLSLAVRLGVSRLRLRKWVRRPFGFDGENSN